ncbi:FadR/GntR family transcriptional regulator [Nocardia jiangxiensis]|uniref:FadR/GntR family transcriptional regulator n=1 Tax=Nocardia jiangxiensis TaxID=282685 RepID=UPI0002EEC86F|nr:FadR/GntR family transcriptional regulator [Nocardia jiangxiensis]
MAGTLHRPIKQSEIVAREITDEIVSQALEEGTRLHNEREMLEKYRVGRSTLREAMRLLESRGIVTVRAGRDGGPVVRRPKPSDLGESLTLLMQFNGIPFSELFAARQALEPLLARMAASRISATEVEELDSINAEMAENLDDRELFRSTNFRFHEVIANASRSPVLELLSASLEWGADGLAFGVVAGDFTTRQRRDVLTAHKELADALRAGDPDRAHDAMASHLDDAHKAWLAAYRDLPLRPVQWASSLAIPARSRP